MEEEEGIMTPTLEDLEKRVDKVETCVDKLQESINQLIGQANTIKLLLAWVVLPLIIIVGGLVGVKIAMPTG